MNASQEKAWTTLADDLVIRVPARELSTSVHPDAHVDWAATFGREAPDAAHVRARFGLFLVSARRGRGRPHGRISRGVVLREHGIEIPYPQRIVHMKPGA